MKKWLLAILILIPLLALYAQEEVILRKDYIKNIVQLLELEPELPPKPTPLDYVNLLNQKGFEISTENLDVPITTEEKSILINKLVNYKLQKRVKAPEGIAEKAIVDEVGGEVLVLKKGKGNWIQAEKGMELGIEDVIKTGVASYIYLRVGKFGRITIKENSELSLKEISYLPVTDRENIILNLARGETIIDATDIKKNSRFEIQTPTTLAAVRGTIYSVKIINGGKRTSVDN